VADATKLDDAAGSNKSFKLALHREEQKLDERQDMDAMEQELGKGDE
jgi:hypothetical protein